MKTCIISLFMAVMTFLFLTTEDCKSAIITEPVQPTAGAAVTKASLRAVPPVQIHKTPFTAGWEKVYIPQISGMDNMQLQSLINDNLKRKILSFNIDPVDASLWGDFTVHFYNRDLLVVHFTGYSMLKGAAHPQKIDTGIHIGLRDGRIYELEDLFRPGSGYASIIRQLCRSGHDSYRLSIEGLWDGWTNDMFDTAWSGQDRAFLLSADALRVYAIPSYAVGAISGYSIPYTALTDVINKDGPLWRSINSKPAEYVELICD